MALRRRTNVQAEIDNLIQDMLVNGTGGDREKWKKTFRTLSKNKEWMKKILEIDCNKAFEQYYLLGEKRSLKRLSDVTNHDLNKLVRWRKKYDWEAKVMERDGLVRNILMAKSAGTIAAIKLQYSGIINHLVQDMIKNIDSYNKKVAEMNKNITDPKQLLNFKNLIYSADDFEKLIKLDLLLRGEATSRAEISIMDKESIVEKQIADDPETKELLKSLYNRNRTYLSTVKNKLPSFAEIRRNNSVAGTNGTAGTVGMEIDITPLEEEEEENEAI
jgi:hypothetical protein